MSLANLTKILVRAVEARDRHDPDARVGVYVLARGTLERFLTESGDLTAEEKVRQRAELDRTIALVEAHYASGRPGSFDLAMVDPAAPVLPPVVAPFAPPPPPQMPPASRPTPPVVPPPPPPPPPVAPPAAPPPPTAVAPTPPAVPTPSAPLAVREPPPVPEPAAPALAESAATSPEADVPPPRPEPPAADLFGDATGAAAYETAADDGPEVASGADWKERNRRGAIVLVLLIFAFAAAYQFSIGDHVRRWLGGDTGQTAGVKPDRPSAAPSATPDGWIRTVLPQLGETPEEKAVDVRLVEEKPGAPTGGRLGRARWTPVAGVDGSWIGRLEFTGSPITVDLAVEPNPDTVDDQSYMLVLALGSAPVVDGTPVLARVDPGSGRTEDFGGLAVRIGVDRFLYGFKPRDVDRSTDIDARPVTRIELPLENDRKLALFLRLPKLR